VVKDAAAAPGHQAGGAAVASSAGAQSGQQEAGRAVGLLAAQIKNPAIWPGSLSPTNCDGSLVRLG